MSEEKETVVFMNKIRSLNAVPNEYLKLLEEKGTNFVAVIANPNQLKKMVLFPTNASKAIYAKINLKKKNRLDDAFFIALREKLTKLNLKTLFTTGVCLKQDECYWEGIFDYFDNFEIDDFKKEMESIESVITIQIKVLNTD